NIWNDHSDSLSQRDSGWLQLFCESNQDAVDTHIMAFKIAEKVGLPVMVCMDGFVLTHAFERLDIPSQEIVDKFLPPYEPRECLTTKEPVSIGSMVGSEAFTEVRFLQQRKMAKAIKVIEEVTKEYRELTGSKSGGLLDCYNCENAQLKLIILGSSVGTAKDEVDRLKEQGINVGIISLKSFRPFPYEAIKEAIGDTKQVICVERAFSFGARGIICPEVKRAMEGTSCDVKTAVCGLGGRPIYGTTIGGIVKAALAGEFKEEFNWFDIDPEVLNKVLGKNGTSFSKGLISQSELEASVKD
ncbi:MAG: transketolase C-terminal domain-containing protein, partial [Succinivibrio sp.]